MPLLRKPELKPLWTTADGATVKLYHGDVVDVLRRLPSGSVHTVVTSPPYWGLRDYGTGTWEGGDESCDHAVDLTSDPSRLKPSPHNKVAGWTTRDATAPAHYSCKCGAKRIDNQIGSEPSPDCGTQGKAQCGRCFVCKMVEVFREVRRVLRDDGTLWLNLGSSYGAEGQMVATPWLVALALQADGWILRQDIVWAKPSPMPESVKNRCTKSHEYIFLLVKRMRYFYDAEAIKEAHTSSGVRHATNNESLEDRTAAGSAYCQSTSGANGFGRDIEYSGRNKRSVWRVSSQGYEGAHFATFPEKLIEPCILAGTSERGCCTKCGAPWRRVVDETKLTRERPNDYVKRTGEEGTGNSCANSVAGVSARTIGWEPTCDCNGKFVKRKGKRLGYGSYHNHEQDGVAYGLRQDGKGPASNPGEPTKEFETTIVEYVSDLPLDKHPIQPCTVLDPFIGSGTTCCVALAAGQRSIGIDLSLDYLRANAIPRIEGELLKRGAASLAARPAKRVEIGERCP